MDTREITGHGRDPVTAVLRIILATTALVMAAAGVILADALHIPPDRECVLRDAPTIMVRDHTLPCAVVWGSDAP